MNLKTLVAHTAETNMRHPITQFTYFGVPYDYTGDGYEIDDDLRVYKNGKTMASKKSIKLTHHGILSGFGTRRLYLTVTRPIPVDIEACSGIRVIDHLLPETDAQRYDWETPSDRDELRRARQARLDALATDIWKPVQYHEDTFDKYEISFKTGAIRITETKANITEGAGTHASRYSICIGKTIKHICSYRAYMCTFESKSRLPHQDQVDHINGDHMDNLPCNLRWVSQSENIMYKFKTNARMEKGASYTGDLRHLKRFRDSNWYFGVVDGDYAVVDRKRMRRVSDFRSTLREPYTRIRIRDHFYLIHRVVALVEGIISQEQFDNPRGNDAVVMHLDDDKTNFRPENLRLGTYSENGFCTQSNPLTTTRKRVRQLDDDGACIAEFESISAAAKVVGGHMRGISRTIAKKNHCYRGYRWELVDITKL